MLSSVNRLREQKEHDLVFNKGLFKKSPYFLMVVYKNPNRLELPSRISFPVSKKVDKRATIRNRIRRILREAFRKTFTDVKNGYDIVVLGNLSVLDAPNIEVVDEVKRMLLSFDLIRK